MKRELSVKKTRKVLNAAMAMSEEPIRNHKQILEMINQFSEEIGKITKGMDIEQRRLVLKAGLDTVIEFKEKPYLKTFLRYPI